MQGFLQLPGDRAIQVFQVDSLPRQPYLLSPVLAQDLCMSSGIGLLLPATSAQCHLFRDS
jgi:hypothetical protein